MLFNRPRPDLPPEIESAVFQHASRAVAGVRQSDSPWTLPVGLAVAALLGLAVFASLSAGRQARADGAARPAPAKPAAAAPAPPQPAPPPPIAQATPPPAPAPAPTGEDPALELRSPLMVVDQSDSKPPGGGAAAATAADPPAHPAVEGGGSAEEKFEARVQSGGVETSRATQLSDLTRVVPQGTVIPAVLETAINSDLPGSVRAVVSQDVHGFDGSQVLVPRGSKLIGQYRSGVAYGQTRAFVVWTRILTPQGVSIDVGSPATDQLGRGGLSGETDTHFFQRFGGSILLSVISVGTEAALARESGTAVIIGSPLEAGALASAAPQQPANIPVTVKVMQGTPLQVFLVRDLDFSGVAPVSPAASGSVEGSAPLR
jgi:type IV secretory pathway VirB10-like protein